MISMMGWKNEFRLNNFGLNHEEPRKFVSSEWGSPRFYIVWRIFWAIFHSSWLLTSIVVTQQIVTSSTLGGAVWLIYLTNWTYLLLTLGALLDAAVVIYVTITKRDVLKECTPTLPWYIKLSWFVYNVVNEGSLHISLFYWLFLFKDQKLTILRFIFHGMNSIYVLCNIAVTAMPVRVYHMIYPLLFGIVYTTFNAMYQLLGGTNRQGQQYIYKITDWSNPKQTIPLVILSMLVFLPCIHLIVYGLYCLRVFVQKKYQGIGEDILQPESDRPEDELL